MEPACAHALSIEAADEADTVALRCSTHDVCSRVALDDEEFCVRIAEWFDVHALCTRLVVPASGQPLAACA